MQVHANALSLNEVFGTSKSHLNVDSRGVLGSVLKPTEPCIHARKVAAVAACSSAGAATPNYQPHSKAGHVWLVLDCALRGGHADLLVPLLLGEAVWCNDGTRVRIHSGQRLLWECTDLREASPLIMSSVGVCVVSPRLIDAYAIIDGVQDIALDKCPLLKLV